VPVVHPSRGTAGTARGADTVRPNEWLDDGNVWKPGATENEHAHVWDYVILV
jgi:hypothetical protein